MDRIGNRLVAGGLIDSAQLQAALEQQRAQGGRLGHHLLNAGALTRQQLQSGLADQWHLEVRDLDREPPDPAVLDSVDLTRAVGLGWVPCELLPDGTLVVATAVRPDQDLVNEVADQFPGTGLRFVACTRRDLDHVAVRALPAVAPIRRPTAALPVGPLRRPVRRRSTILLPAVLVGLVGLVGWVVAGMAFLGPDGPVSAALLVLGALFAAGVALQCRAALRRAADRRDSPTIAAGADDNDAALPVYSVLVPFIGDQPRLERVLRDLAALDYPSSHLDVLLLVPDEEETLQAVAACAPPVWVRVLALPATRYADAWLRYDEGLALARGRHVVVLPPDCVPQPQQLRRAVAAFDADLAENLRRADHRPPLTGLRVEQLDRDPSAPLLSALHRLDGTLALTGVPRSSRDPDSVLASLHLNTGVVRRSGGFRALTGPGDSRSVAPRIAALFCTTERRRPVDLRHVVRRRAGELRGASTVYPPDGRASPQRVAETTVFLVYPVLLVSAASFVVRAPEQEGWTLLVGLLGLAGLSLGLVAAVVVGGTLAAREPGARARFAVLLPVWWLVHATAAWSAVASSGSRDGVP